MIRHVTRFDSYPYETSVSSYVTIYDAPSFVITYQATGDLESTFARDFAPLLAATTVSIISREIAQADHPATG